MDYRSVGEARDLPGVKLVLTAGVPGPWSESAKAVLKHHAIDYVPVRQEAMAPNPELVAWTGCRNAPQLVSGDEPSLTGWHDILAFAERTGTGASLLPEAPDARAMALGIAAMILGPGGIGWCHRTAMMARMGGTRAESPLAPIARAYGCEGDEISAAPARTAELLRFLDERLALGEGYLAGPALSAPDLYWAAISNMFAPLPREVNPMPDYLWKLYGPGCAEVEAAITPTLLAHRDRVWRDHIGLPLDY